MDNKRIMQDVRTAHRLAFEYQKRMLRLVFSIKDRLGFTSRMEGRKHFSEPIGPIRNGYGDLAIFPDMWAWDFLYSYEMEYYFGQRAVSVNKQENYCAMSALQVTDSGWFDADETVKQGHTSEFVPAEKSKSYLVFLFESTKVKGKWSELWNPNRPFVRDVCKSEADTSCRETENGCFVWYRVNIEELMTPEEVAAIVPKIAEVIKDKTQIDMLQEKP